MNVKTTLTRIESDSRTGTIRKDQVETSKPLIITPNTRARPAREAALDDAFAAFAVAMRQVRVTVEGGDLNPIAVDILVKLTNTYTKLVRTDILHDQHQDPSSHNDQDLLSMIEQARSALGAGDIEVE